MDALLKSKPELQKQLESRGQQVQSPYLGSNTLQGLFCLEDLRGSVISSGAMSSRFCMARPVS